MSSVAILFCQFLAIWNHKNLPNSNFSAKEGSKFSQVLNKRSKMAKDFILFLPKWQYFAADYVEIANTNIKFVATTTNNNQINFWDSNNYIFRDRMNTNEI